MIDADKMSVTICLESFELQTNITVATAFEESCIHAMGGIT